MKLPSKTRCLQLCAAVVILNLIFIWGNSLMPGHISAAISGFVRDFLSLFFSGAGEEGPVSGVGVLRKLAHFLEFCSLGFFLSFMMTLLKKRPFFSAPLGALAGCIDECIQLFVPERGPHIRDVGIDTLGVIAGLGVFTIALFLYKRKKSTIMEETNL